MESVRTKRVLIGPLDWGLGHASRCVPIILSLQAHGAHVILAASTKIINFFQNECPGLDSIELKGFSPEYPRHGNLTLRMIRLIPDFAYSIIRENKQLARLIKDYEIDIVISDNRYGLWNKKIKSIFIIHQIFIRAPQNIRWLNPLLFLINKFLISFYDECWIPDFEKAENLSGELSHKRTLPKNYHFIGPLSRLSCPVFPQVNKKGILIVLSGPEPQRGLLEQLLIDQLSELNQPALMICGRVQKHCNTRNIGQLRIMDYATTNQMNEYLQSCSLVICRPGYSTIMDLARIGGKALFIPTPGQTEQEYLAEYFMNRGMALSVEQKHLNLARNIPDTLSFKGFNPTDAGLLMEQRIEILYNS